MKSIEKLREYVDKQRDEYNNHNVSFVWQLSTIADEIEAEIADNYMRLPLDADNVPIHVGDEIQYVNEQGGTGAKVKVCAIADGYVFYDNGKHIHAHSSDSTRHVKPRTLEDVLRDCCNEWNQHLGSDWEAGVYAKYADEIRELLGGDAE